MRAAIVAVALLAPLALSGCETTAEKSARLEKSAHHTRLAEHGLSIATPNADIRVLDAILVHGGEGAAAVVTLRNDSSRTLRDVPIEITVKDAHGSTLFQNNAPGLEPALTSLESLPANGEAVWVDDQVPANGAPASVSAIAGVAPAVNGPVPRLQARDVRLSEENGSVEAAGTVRNRSNVTQQNLVVYVLARRAGKIVAAGRAVLPEVAGGASAPFQAFLTGNSAGARLEASAPASTFG